MGRISGRNGRVYVNLTSGGTAEPVTFVTSWSINQSSDRYDATAMGDGSKVYVAGLPDAQGNLNAIYDTDTQQWYGAALDGIARKTYLYTDIVGKPGQYWFGTALFDFNVDEPVAGVVEVTGSWAAASAFAKVG